MKTIAIRSVKGGQGTTTFIAALAIEHDGPTVIIGEDTDLAAVFGLSGDADGRLATELANNVWYFPTGDADQELLAQKLEQDHLLVLIVDDADPEMLVDMNLLVIRPCYLALRRAVKTAKWGMEGHVLVDDESRSLGQRDVANVLGTPTVATVPIKAAIARAVDAGVLPTRLPDALRRPAREVLRKAGIVTADA